MSWSYREALTNSREGLGDPPGCLAVIGKPSRMPGRPSKMSGSDWVALLDVRERLGNPPGCQGVLLRCPGVIGWPS